MADDFSRSVQFGLKLAQRIYYGKGMAPAPALMERKSQKKSYLPTAPMMYAVITEPSMVDHPDIPSYQPYVHGRCDPPALIPLQMHEVTVEIDSYLDTSFVNFTGKWRLHCVSSSRSCECRIAVPLGEQGSILGVEVECPATSYCTQLLATEDCKDADKAKDGFLLKHQIYTLKIPPVNGGTTISANFNWSQKLLYQGDEFCLNVPFSFPEYVNPVGRRMSKKEKILLSVNSGMGLEILCKSCSHPLKEVRRHAGQLGFSYEQEVAKWSVNDLIFSYSVPSSDLYASVLLQSPTMQGFDQRDMFCIYLYPGNTVSRKVFKKEIVFIVDISASMGGGPLEDAKAAVFSALSKLDRADKFNIIAFNENSLLFSSSMELATLESIEKAIQWIDKSFQADGGTNIYSPLSQALKMASQSADSIPVIFLITDGTVEDEKEICNAIKGQLQHGEVSPRISTFGIGTYCNHYFLQMLAQIGRGCYDAAYDEDSIKCRMERLFDQVSSIILKDIRIDGLEILDSFELYPVDLPDLSTGSPLIVSGRYTGKFPDSVKLAGTLADFSPFVLNAKVRNAKELPLERVLAKRHIDTLTATAWLSGSKQLEEKIMKMSLHTGVPSEYTNIVLVQSNNVKEVYKPDVKEEDQEIVDTSGKKIIFLRSIGLRFGDLKATLDNLHMKTAEPKLQEPSETIAAAASCCNKMMDCCCCMCFIQCCSRLNDQCVVVFTQLCSALACFGCFNFCCEICDCCDF